MRRNKLFFLAVLILSTVISINLISATIPNRQTIKPIDIHFISTVNSDCILISDNGKYAMIDGADNDDEQFLVDYLNNLVIKELEYLILTHPDVDHSDAFIKAISPKYAVICCGKDNKYGHPHKETTTTLNKYKMAICRTDLNGTITVTSDGEKITVATENKAIDI